MPKGPNGQKRPGDVIGAAIMGGKIVDDEAAFDERLKKRATALKPSNEAGKAD